MQKNTEMWRLLFLVCVTGVFGPDEVKSVSVMEGDSVTLNITETLTDQQIVWMFGPRETRIAEIFKKSIDMYDSNEIFGDRLKLDSQTGSLTITNIKITHTGLYKLQIISNRGNLQKSFRVSVYAPLPVPVINRYCPQNPPSSKKSSSLKCILLCSVLNVRDVSLSWYKENHSSLSTSASDLISKISLHLDVEYQDTNTYSCVVNNAITKQAQHLNMNDVCQPCSDFGRSFSFTEVVVQLVLSALVVVAIVAIVVYDIRSRRVEAERSDITLRPCVFGVDGDEMKSVSVMEGDSVTLHTDITEILNNHQILWMYGSQGIHIAQIIKWANLSSIYDNDERFRDRLKLDSQTGSLTITNIRITNSGLYKLTISNYKDASYKRFNVTVYEKVPEKVPEKEESPSKNLTAVDDNVYEDYTPCCSLTETVSRLAISAVVGVATLTVVIFELSS
ncbi:uncharacterized protein [Misgurnus anguillicaudatus]|uniref:uncharacterized protein n=1 Tax=Misgurnus anguillicaudatus TaxID=75329 RepID=UPI003CCF71EA